MDWKTYIHSDPKILLGKPVVEGLVVEGSVVGKIDYRSWPEFTTAMCWPQQCNSVI